jgi:hypothetical protein
LRSVLINVALREGCEDPDDAVGLWEVELNEDYPPGIAAGAAKDIFHSSVAIETLDDYEIDTLDPETRERIDEDEDYESYSQSQCGKIRRIGDAIELS